MPFTPSILYTSVHALLHRIVSYVAVKLMNDTVCVSKTFPPAPLLRIVTLYYEPTDQGLIQGGVVFDRVVSHESIWSRGGVVFDRVVSHVSV